MLFLSLLSVVVAVLTIVSAVFFGVGFAISEPGVSIFCGSLFVFMLIVFIRLRVSIKARKASLSSLKDIDYVVIVGQESAGSISGNVRGFGGKDFLVTTPTYTNTTLVIHYKSGNTQTKRVKLDSKEFKMYAPYIR